MNTEQQPQGLVKLIGTIRNYKATRAEASFVFTDSDRTKLGVIAIAAGIAGLSGPAISTASYAASTVETADYVEFELDGNPVKVKGIQTFKDDDTMTFVMHEGKDANSLEEVFSIEYKRRK